MAEVAAGLQAVAHELLQGLDARKAVVALAIPDELTFILDTEGAARRGYQRDLPDILGKRREKLLRHPGGPQQPLTLAAIGDRDARLPAFTELAHGPPPI